MRPCATISLVPSLAGGPWIYWDELAVSVPKAAAAGFEAVELFFAAPEEVDAAELRGLCGRTGVRLAAVGTGAGKVLRGLTLTSPDAAIRRQAVEFVKSIIDFGAPFSAPAIIGSIQGSVAGTDKARALELLAEALRELAESAARQGTALIYEPLNRYETNLINRLGDAVAFFERHRLGNIRLLADLFHMNIEEESLGDAIRSFGEWIGHVHFADSNRRPVGFGHTEMGEAAAALRAIGYAGYLSAEALPFPDPDTAAAQTMRAFRFITKTK